jgi:hypothetical protein
MDQREARPIQPTGRDPPAWPNSAGAALKEDESMEIVRALSELTRVRVVSGSGSEPIDNVRFSTELTHEILSPRLTQLI